MRIRVALLCLALGLVYCSDDKKPPAGGNDDPCASLACDNNTSCAVVDGNATCVCNDDCTPPVITGPGSALADITIDTAAASITLTASGAAPFRWQVTAGALPAGMSLDESSGIYSGTPTTLGDYAFTVTATNGFGSDTRAFTQTVTTPPANAYLLLSGSRLVPFHLDYPTAPADEVQLTGVIAGEELVAIDRRPLNNMLYALGVNASADTMTLYNVVLATATVFPVGAVSVGFTTDGTTVVNLPAGRYDIDFSPSADRIRVVAGALNFRINPTTGGLIDGDNTGLTVGSVNGTNPDAAINGGSTTLYAVAYTSNELNATGTTAYGLDSNSNALYILNPPNQGTIGTSSAVTLNGSAVDFVVAGFDILQGVNAAAPNSPVTLGSGRAVLNLGTESRLAVLDLTNGQITSTALLPQSDIVGFAMYGEPQRPALALRPSNELIRFTIEAPDVVRTIALNFATPNETLVAIDFRHRTGQLFGLGINATDDQGTLYLIDPTSGVVQAVGAVGAITVGDGSPTPVDLPPTNVVRYDIDFNEAVDRLRVITSSGLNFRVNPTTGAVVAKDTNLAGAALPQALAYAGHPGDTNSTALVIDAGSHDLFLLNPPNNGTLSLATVLTNGSSHLAFSSCLGFDIPAVGVPAANTVPPGGVGYAFFASGGVTSLFALHLDTGAFANLANMTGDLLDLTVGSVAP